MPAPQVAFCGKKNEPTFCTRSQPALSLASVRRRCGTAFWSIATTAASGRTVPEYGRGPALRSAHAGLTCFKNAARVDVWEPW